MSVYFGFWLFCFGVEKSLFLSVGGMIFGARDLRGLENKTQLSSVLSAIRSRMKDRQNPPMYLSLDIDCLDPAFAPGTGTPVIKRNEKMC